MSSAHSIRLQGPWETAPLTPANASFLKIHLPGEVERLSYFPGGFRLKRRFHRPTGLTAGDVLFLTLPVPAAGVAVQLNGSSLAAEGKEAFLSRWQIGALELTNVLVITLRDDSSEEWARWREPVVLEIHAAPEPPAGSG